MEKEKFFGNYWDRDFFGTLNKDIDTLWTSYKDKFASREKIRDFKKRISGACSAEFIPIRINVSPIYKFSVYRLNRFVLNIDPEYMKLLNSDERLNKFIKAIKKLPMNSHSLHGAWVHAYIREDRDWLTYLHGDYNYRQAFELVTKYFNGEIGYEDAIKAFRSSDSEDEGGGGDWSAHTFTGGGRVGSLQLVSNLELYKEALKMMSKKFLKQSVAILTPSLRSGKRINRAFVEGTSYEPLVSRSVVAPHKAKAMVILDCSGSMRGYTSEKAASFISALVNSGVVDITHVIYHSSSGWEDVLPKIKKGNVFYYGGGDEGFQYIDDNLPTEWIKEVDYVVACTDLRYESHEEEGLYEYIKRAKRHLVLSFARSGTLKDMQVQKIDTIKDMAKAVIKLI